MWSLSGLVRGLVGGVVTLIVLAARAGIEGRSGLTFADLWTALIVGTAIGIVPFVLARLMEWWIRRIHGGSFEGQWRTHARSVDPGRQRPGRPTHVSHPVDSMDRF